MAGNALKIAVTGSIGSGKSTVSRMLAAQLRARYVDTDQLCRLEMQPGAEGYNQFLQQSGGKYFAHDGMLDRDKLRTAVFNDPGERMNLEAVLHPLVQRRVSALFMRCAADGCSLVVEVPLLFETGWHEHFDDHLLVFVALPEIYRRVALRSKLDRVMITRILAAQMPMATKRQLANHVVDNSGLFVSVVQQISWVSKKIGKKSKKG
jgi:dephospho-CoA kinase